MKSIYTYDSYRSYLEDFYLFRKEGGLNYTYAKFAKDAELNSPNYLKMVIDGERNLTISNIHQFAKALQLNFEELIYFEALVLREQSTNTSEKSYYSNRLLELRRVKPLRGARIKSHEFISQWYVPAIIFGLSGRPESTDLSKIAKMIGISQEQIEESIRALSRRKILKIKDGNFYCDSNHLVYRDSRASNISQKNYLKSQLSRSVHAFEKKYFKGAKFHSHTFSLPSSEFGYYEDRLNSLIEEIIAKADSGEPDKMAQLNFQFFTLED